MKCVILTAGKGERLLPFTETCQKTMIRVANKPFLEHVIKRLSGAGIHDFVFVVGHRSEEIEKYFGDGSEYNIAIEYVYQKEQKGTGHAVLVTEKYINDDFLVLNGDILINSYDIRKFCSDKNIPCIGVYKKENNSDFGVVQFKDNVLTGLEEKPKVSKSEYINAGLYKFTTDVFDILKDVKFSERGEIELTDAIYSMMNLNEVYVHVIGNWMGLDRSWDLLDINKKLCLDFLGSVKGIIENDVYVRGSIGVGAGTVIKSGTYIEGNCVIGNNCTIGPHAYIRGSTSIGNGCHIGHGVEVKNSVIMDGTKIPHLSYIGDSVIGSRCNFGAGTKVANLRNDKKTVYIKGIDSGRKKLGAIIGDDVKFGINCSINVGSYIGNGCGFPPNAYITGEIDGT